MIRTRNPSGHRDSKEGGFTLPSILVVVGALLILAVGLLLIVGIERSTARSYVDQKRADLAAQAALEDLRGVLTAEAANDDYLIIQSNAAKTISDKPDDKDRQLAPFLFLTRGKSAGANYSFRHVPLFSTKSKPTDSSLVSPSIEALVGSKDSDYHKFETLPYQDKVMAAWLPVYDTSGQKIVARYAYWVEDLQGKIDPQKAGNQDGNLGKHVREAYPFPAPGIDDPGTGAKTQTSLNQVALFAVDPSATSDDQKTLGKTLYDKRGLMITPGSSLAAGGFTPPLQRLAGKEPPGPSNQDIFGRPGELVDKNGRTVEESLYPGLKSYNERALVPYASGIDPSVAGKPKLNLNKLVVTGGDSAVSEMADFIRKALPRFEQRKGGFPEDYVKTLAANAIDYADSDSSSTLLPGTYRGLDAFPLLSEEVIQINYEGIANYKDRKVLNFRMKLFAELFNPANVPVNGDARLSYEVALPVDGIGSGTGDQPFDAPELLTNPDRSTHDLDLINGKYWTKSKNVSLAPNQYLALQFAEVVYRIDVGPSSALIPGSTPFSLREDRGISGLTLKWRGQDVDRVAGLVRQEGLIANPDGSGGFKVGTKKTSGKAALPGHVHDNFYPSMHYNMGDTRITYYLRKSPAAENAYPDNISPNRRNIRINIYKTDASGWPKVYSRVLPSEWPDGGHNAAVGNWTPGSSDTTLFNDSKFNFGYDPKMEFSAPQIISNRNWFYCACELGRVFDPIMYAPAFAKSTETDSLVKTGVMPSSQRSWPDAIRGQDSPYYGGGNTLRIGRAEHKAFDVESERDMHAVRLLDLFHTGITGTHASKDREGELTLIDGNINLNTASRDALRAMAAGTLVMDPTLMVQTSTNHSGTPNMAPPTKTLKLSAPTLATEADRIADAVIRNRPYASPSDMVFARGSDGAYVFGNKESYKEGANIEWSDEAAEEVFARMYNTSTVRSRNFRIWIVAQALAPTDNPNATPEVLAEVRKSYCLFADPGERNPDGSIDPLKFKTSITFENDF